MNTRRNEALPGAEQGAADLLFNYGLFEAPPRRENKAHASRVEPSNVCYRTRLRRPCLSGYLQRAPVRILKG
jgi:hypothetical protein